MGESFGLYKLGDDEGIMPTSPWPTSPAAFTARIPAVMRQDRPPGQAAQRQGGAHPSLPDLQGFGRREMKMDSDELTACLIYQIGALKAFLDVEGMKLNHIKPHGGAVRHGSAFRGGRQRHLRNAAEPFGVPAARHGPHQARGGLRQARQSRSSPNTMSTSTMTRPAG